MRAPPVAGILVLLLVGCVGEPTQPAALDELLPPQDLPAVFSVIDPDGGHGEPSFGVAPDGTLFANGRGGRGGAVYRSLDDGTTWEQIATPVEPMPNFDPDLAVDVDGTVWFSALWVGCSSVAVSRDGGESFTSNPAVCSYGPVADRQYVIPTKGGTAYMYAHQIPTFHQTAAKTTDYGQTWIPLGTTEGANHFLVNGGSGWGGGGFWNAVTDSVYFTYRWQECGLAEAVTGCVWGAGYSVSYDGGATWDVGYVPSMGGRPLGLALTVGAADDAGNVYLAWGEEKDEDVAVYLAVSRDDGANWGEPIRVDNMTKGSKVFPAITAGPAGKVAIAYYESDTPGFPSDVGGDALWNVTLA